VAAAFAVLCCAFKGSAFGLALRIITNHEHACINRIQSIEERRINSRKLNIKT
jgi:hypothetical protein